MSNFWKEQFDKHPDAEGIDFVSLIARPWKPGTIYDTKTREQMIAGCAYPRSNYLFWKMVDGKKVYIYKEKDKLKPGSVHCHAEHRKLFAIIDDDEAIWGVFDNRQDAEEIAMSLYEELAYETALDLYLWHHHWDMEHATTEAWEGYVGWTYLVKPIDFWSFSPF